MLAVVVGRPVVAGKDPLVNSTGTSSVSPQDLASGHAPLAVGTGPPRGDGQDRQVGVFAHRALAKRRVGRREQLRLDARELADAHEQPPHGDAPELVRRVRKSMIWLL